jgi:SAM-dependent methyltransferase
MLFLRRREARSGAQARWRALSSQPNWRDFILPGRSDFQFELEGFIEAQRLYYLMGERDTVVDYGCGIGRVAKYVAERAQHVIGVDIDERFVAMARRLVLRPNVEFHVATRYRARTVADLTYSLMVFPHNPPEDRQRIMRHIMEITRPGGTVFAQFPRAESTYYVEADFVHKFGRDEVRALAEGLRDVRIIEGNLAKYERPADPSMSHEYFLLARR